MIYKTPRHSLNKAFLKVKPLRLEIDLFKDNLASLLHLTETQLQESEEFHKNNLRSFLNNIYYRQSHYINTKDQDDLVIYNGQNIDSKVGVIMEIKHPNNNTEMISFERFNNKALQQLLWYYLQERIVHKNFEIKHLIITNIYDWFVFDANVFEKLFYQDNRSLIKQFDDFRENRLTSTKTELFYKEIAQKAIAKVENELKKNCTYFNLKDYQNQEDHSLIIPYKFLSPSHLLKLPFANDSNSLDQGFYNELLHIIGLIEVKQGSKRLIKRLPEKNRNKASLLENTIEQLDTYEKLNLLKNKSSFGATYQEQLFNVALELVITWINRILFLRLLEAQLINYNKSEQNISFLNITKIGNFHDLDILFFQVLAKKITDRKEDIQAKFSHLPYLNSSLFEVTTLENQLIPIASLNDAYKLPLFSNTILKDNQGKKKQNSLNTLPYLFEFLAAYDFSSEGETEIQEENKTLINASVLGLIFEKINGYQDGSFFTPGFITMYMCKETIRPAIIQKFNQVKGWNCQNIVDLYNKIEDNQEANQIFNSIKICDPAVGSGHFLVSALQEIIAFKSELKILQDREGKRLKNYTVTVENDELIILDEDGNLFSYNPNNKESQRVQETLFHEKQTIIENCLFGVDININSVKICRLRLWIELLKNSYYKPSPLTPLPQERGTSSSEFPHLTKGDVSNSSSEFPHLTKKEVSNSSSVVPHLTKKEVSNSSSVVPHLTKGGLGGVKTLETLPNIDINIKCGNSLISRFDLTEDLGVALKKSKLTIESYQKAVQTYRNPENKAEKQEMERLIKDIKENFTTEMTINDPLYHKLRQKEGELYNLQNQTSLFEESTKEKKAREKQQRQLEKELNLLNKKIEDKQNNRIYSHSFEWRFEFPEVLNNEGDFIGFDLIIGNPPYMRIQEIQKNNSFFAQYLKENFISASGSFDIYCCFIEIATKLINKQGNIAYIVPHKFFQASFGKKLRQLIAKDNMLKQIVDFGASQVFESATTYTCLLFLNRHNENLKFIELQANTKLTNLTNILSLVTNNNSVENDFVEAGLISNGDLDEKEWNFCIGKKAQLLTKLKSQPRTLADICSKIFQGIATSADRIYFLEHKSEKDGIITAYSNSLNCDITIEKQFVKPLLKGADVHRFQPLNPKIWCIFPYHLENNQARLYSQTEIQNQFPLAWDYLLANQTDLENREKGKMKHDQFYAYIYPKNLTEFDRSKIITPDIASGCQMTLDYSGLYHTTTIYSFVFKEDTQESVKYYLALLNSQLLWYFLTSTGSVLRGDFFRFKTNYLKPFPIPQELSLKKQQPFIKLVDKILEKKANNREADTSKLEKEIDRLVYQLYGLTEEEIKIVES